MIERSEEELKGISSKDIVKAKQIIRVAAGTDVPALDQAIDVLAGMVAVNEQVKREGRRKFIRRLGVGVGVPVALVAGGAVGIPLARAFYNGHLSPEAQERFAQEAKTRREAAERARQEEEGQKREEFLRFIREHHLTTNPTVQSEAHWRLSSHSGDKVESIPNLRPEAASVLYTPGEEMYFPYYPSGITHPFRNQGRIWLFDHQLDETTVATEFRIQFDTKPNEWGAKKYPAERYFLLTDTKSPTNPVIAVENMKSNHKFLLGLERTSQPNILYRAHYLQEKS